MVRRKLFSMLVLVGLILTCFSTTASEPSQTSSRDPHEIPIRTHDDEILPPGTPRTPALVPVSCYFDDTAGYLYFSFLFPMGDVTITLTEASVGVVSENDYSTSTCFVSIPVPGPGVYDISILLESGTEYTGSFVYLI
ncbi:MAG: DUF3244 domain-containing protein [Bacteroidales bacterium]|nr:DUF3244 domain-containing protein [Bacteroidales bacterium]